ncbi:zinc transporter ZIP1-like isoform X1 [Antennarius striatus]|uniref:zinc transporter ZIP1-like isoform X1 n=1 Tax=Antennarius striatus TaxID=241820 RepID=UPI0035B3219D
MFVDGRVSSSVLLPPGGASAALQVNPAHVPALEIKLAALVVLPCVMLLLGLAPLCMVRVVGSPCLDPGAPHRRLSLTGCFTGGVLMATCLLGQLPDYLGGINQAFSAAGIPLHFPLPEFILAMGFFLVLVLEQMVLTFRDQSASPVEERRSLLLDSTIQEVDRIAQRPSRRRRCPDDSDGVRSQLALRAFILVFSLSLHSVFQGLAVGLLQDGAQVLEMCPALMIHKSMVSFSLVFTLCRDQLRRPVVAGCLLLFAAMSPLGLGVGVALSEAGAPPQHQLARSTLEGLATGAFIYVTFMEILPQELSSSRNRILKVAMLLLGFAVVTAVLFLRM